MLHPINAHYLYIAGYGYIYSYTARLTFVIIGFFFCFVLNYYSKYNGSWVSANLFALE